MYSLSSSGWSRHAFVESSLLCVWVCLKAGSVEGSDTCWGGRPAAAPWKTEEMSLALV